MCKIEILEHAQANQSKSSMKRLFIKSAAISDMRELLAFRELAISDTDREQSGPSLITRDINGGPAELEKMILDRCVLVARDRHGEIQASGALDLDNLTLVGLAVRPSRADFQADSKILVALERLAVDFGIADIRLLPTDRSLLPFRGYRPASADASLPNLMIRSLSRRETSMARTVRAFSRKLGIPQDYGVKHRMPMQKEAHRLESIGHDIFNREQRLTPKAARQWLHMCSAALSDKVELQAVSAFRSIDYQAGIVRRKLKKGQTIEQILMVSAAPGFSEHHTGRAIDISQPGFEPLEEEFEQSPAYQWLMENAARFNFKLSFPRENRHGVAFEPWHWACK